MGRLIFVGLGLTLDDITPAARRAIDSADEVVAEFYTSRIVGANPKQIAQVFDRPIRFLRRREVEEDGQAIIDAARDGVVAFLTGGDAMTATTHAELRAQAIEQGIDTQIVHGVSIQTAAAGQVGLQSYKFGRTTTLVMPQGDYLPESPFDVIEQNMQRGLHTLVLLDLRQEDEQYMRTHEAAGVLLRIASGRADALLGPSTMAVACARVGAADQEYVAADLSALAELDLGEPLHCLLVPGKLHFTEKQAIDRLRPK